MKKILFLTAAISVFNGFSQTLISKNPGAVPNPDALLEVRTQFSSPRGFLMPSTTFGQISGNLFPRIDNTINVSFDNDGLLIYASDSSKFMYFRDDYNAFTLLNPWTLSADGSILSYEAPDITGFGLGTSNPLSFMDVAGGVTIGAGYAGNDAAPVDGLIVEGKTVIGTNTIDADSNVKLQVAGKATFDSLSTSGDINVLGSLEVNNEITVSGSQDYRYSSPKRRRVVIPFTSFVVNTAENWVYEDDLLKSENSGTVTARASIILPDRSRIKQVYIGVLDNNSNGNVDCEIKLNKSVGLDIPASIDGSSSRLANGDVLIGYDDFIRYYCECKIFTSSGNHNNLGIRFLRVEYEVNWAD
ncbi:MAG: hypothetical protein ABJG78_02390 [Cyclobacteriaceae bacterium]